MRSEEKIQTNKHIRMRPNMAVLPFFISAMSGEITINGWKGSVMWGRNEGGWEHVSVTPFDGHIPTWEEMCMIKTIFWGPEETVIQFFPKEDQYVNIVDNCLHLWKPKDPETQRRLEM